MGVFSNIAQGKGILTFYRYCSPCPGAYYCPSIIVTEHSGHELASSAIFEPTDILLATTGEDGNLSSREDE